MVASDTDPHVFFSKLVKLCDELGNLGKVGSKKYLATSLYIYSHITLNNEPYLAGSFVMLTSYQSWVWKREAHINWSMVTCQGNTRSGLP